MGNSCEWGTCENKANVGGDCFGAPLLAMTGICERPVASNKANVAAGRMVGTTQPVGRPGEAILSNKANLEWAYEY